jgi:uncharacterized protein (DUF885 family)
LTAWVGATDAGLAARIEQAWKAEVPKANKSRRPRSDENVSATQDKRDADAVLSRLKRDDPALAEQVVDGRITSNAAALQKGWRKPKIVLSTPASVAERIRKHWTPEQIAALVQALGNPCDRNGYTP